MIQSPGSGEFEIWPENPDQSRTILEKYKQSCYQPQAKVFSQKPCKVSGEKLSLNSVEKIPVKLSQIPEEINGGNLEGMIANGSSCSENWCDFSAVDNPNCQILDSFVINTEERLQCEDSSIWSSIFEETEIPLLEYPDETRMILEKGFSQSSESNERMDDKSSDPGLFCDNFIVIGEPNWQIPLLEFPESEKLVDWEEL